MVKFFLNVGQDEQKRRFLERIDNPEKNWKFRADDLKVRDKYDAHLKCFNDVINKTSTKNSPWYVLPGDQRWYTRYLVTEILLDALKACKPEYPQLPDDEKEKLPECRKVLAEAMAEYESAKNDKKPEKKSDDTKKKAKKKSKK